MKVNLPSSQTHPLVRVTAKTPKGETTTTLDDTHSTLEVAIPMGIREDQVEVTAQLCDARGEPDKRMEPIVLKAMSETSARLTKRHPAKPKPAEKPAEKSVEKRKGRHRLLWTFMPRFGADIGGHRLGRTEKSSGLAECVSRLADWELGSGCTQPLRGVPENGDVLLRAARRSPARCTPSRSPPR